MTSAHPNILFIQTDQLTINVLAAYGTAIAKTPQLDRLAGEGIVFDTAYCNFPLCAPSRFSMAAGQLASRIGAYDNAAEFSSTIPTYAHHMRALGYQTCLSGKMHFVGPDQLHGFERRLTSDIYPSDFEWTADWGAADFDGASDDRIVTQSGVCARSVQIDYDDAVAFRAVQEIYDIARRDDPRPFFLQVSFTHPHDPYLCTQDHWDRYTDDEISPPASSRPADATNDPHSLRILAQHGLAEGGFTDDDIQRARRAYCGSVSYIDDKVGELRAALAASGLADNTVIVFCSDHGEMLGERGLWLKKTFFEPALRVPLIFHAPGRFAADRVATACSLVDLLPTFASLGSSGTWQPLEREPCDGDDLTLFMGKEARPRDIVAELLSEGVPTPTVMLRRAGKKFIWNGVDPDQLYDLDADPHERTNIAATEPKTAAALHTEIASRYDFEALTVEILKSQQRRLFIKDAMKRGRRTSWDFVAEGDDENWFRGAENYNDWAFRRLG